MALVRKCVVTEPSSFAKVVEDPAWVDAMVEEYDSIVRNSAWEIVPRLEGKSMIEGIDYEETFAPVGRYSSIWTILALSTQMGWHIHQLDVKTAFLNGGIDEEVYIEQLEGFEIFISESHVHAQESDIVVDGKLLIIVLYVDDLILTGDEMLILSCKEDLAREFEMKDLGLLHYFLGLEIWQCNDGLFVSQGKYAWEILEKFNMHGCKPVDTHLLGGWRKEDATSAEVVDATVYRQWVGSLMYLVNTRPDICYAVNQISQAMVKPTKLFWKVGKHVLRYLRGTSGYGLWYRQEDEVKLCGFTDADWAGSPMDRKSTSRGIFSIGSTTISWYNKKQRSMALSSTEAEYIAASLAACEAIWMRKILIGLFRSHLDPTVTYCDNQSCIKLLANLVFHDRSKHSDIRYHHIRDCVQQRIMLLSYIPTEDQDVDILTKVLTKSKFEYHRDRIGVVDNPYLVEREC
eukprot:PITA_30768